MPDRGDNTLSPHVSTKVLAGKNSRLSDQERQALRDEAEDQRTKQEVSGGVTMKESPSKVDPDPKEIPPPQGIRITMVYRKDPGTAQESEQREQDAPVDASGAPHSSNDAQ